MIAILTLALVLAGCTGGPSGETSAASSAAKSDQPKVAAAPAAAAAPQAAAPVGPSPKVRIVAGKGAVGEVVAVEAVLEKGNGVLAAASTDLRYDPRELRVSTDAKGEADCSIEEALAGASVKKQLFARERVEGDQAVLRVALLGVDNANPVPDGRLFTCRFRIASDTGAGEKKLAARSTGADASAKAVVIESTDAVVLVN